MVTSISLRSVAKGYDTFLPYGPIIPASDVEDPENLVINLDINGAF